MVYVPYVLGLGRHWGSSVEHRERLGEVGKGVVMLVDINAQ